MIKVGTDFSGVGAPEQALKELEIEHVVEFACDKDKYARQTYLANHSAKIMYDDVTTRDNSAAPYVDLYCFGFPCQAFSISGKRKGFEDVRGTLFFNSADYIDKKRPRIFIAENVKGLLSHDKTKGSKSLHGRTFSTIINVLAKTINGQTLMPMYEDNLGYHVFYTVLNSKFYDVPQNRERIFIVGFRDDADAAGFKFPQQKTVNKKLADVLEPNVAERYFLNDRMVQSFLFKEKNPDADVIVDGSVSPYSQSAMVYNADGISPSMISGTHGYAMGYINDPKAGAMRGRNEGDEIEQKLEIRKDDITNTITSVQKDNLIIVGNAYGEKQQADDRERGQQLILMHCSKFVCHYSNKAIGMAIEYSKYDPEKVYSCPVCGSPYVLDVERDIDDLLLDLGISTDKN